MFLLCTFDVFPFLDARAVNHSETMFGFAITTRSITDLLVSISRWLDLGERARYCVCANPHCLEKARKDSVYDYAIRQADYVMPDGVGIILASKIFGGTIRKRINGTDIFLT